MWFPVTTAAAAIAVIAVSAEAPAQSATVSGIVISATPPARPIPGAVVTLGPAGAATSRAVLTDDRGVFEFRDVAAGPYPVTATKAGYLTAAFGAAAPGGSGVPVAVLAGRAPDRLEITLTPAASISGVVRDRRGNGLPGVAVTALRWTYSRGPFMRGIRALRPEAGAKPALTDQQGRYRIFDLPPGDFVASVGERLPTSDVSEMLMTTAEDVVRAEQILAGRPVTGGGRASAPIAVGYPQTFHPSTSSAAQAGVIRLVAGDDRAGVDLIMRSEATLAIAGRVIDREGRVFSRQPTVWLEPIDRSVEESRYPVVIVKPDGTFTAPRMFGSGYLVRARANLNAPTGRGSTHWAQLRVPDAPNALKTVDLVLQPALPVEGRLEFESATASSVPRAGGINVTFFEAGHVILYDVPGTTTAADGSFVVAGLAPAKYRVSVDAIADWRLKSIHGAGDTDLADATLSIEAGGQPPKLVVTYTQQTTELNGVFQDVAGKPASAYTVIAFSDDRRYWTPHTRRVAAMRPATDGSFRFANLPPGPYRLAAVLQVEEMQWFNPDFLISIRGAGLAVTIPDGGKVTQNLRIAR